MILRIKAQKKFIIFAFKKLHNATYGIFERCIDFLVRMIDKYGAEVLRELEEEKQNKEEKEAAVF